MKLHNHADLSTLNTFRVPSRARYFVSIERENELIEVLDHADEKDLPLFILGGGSNTLFVGDFPGLVLLMDTRGCHISGGGGGWVQLEAGQNWHNAVRFCLQNGLYGIENLALIPGNCGAAPIQNIGAYGVELSRFCCRVKAVHRGNGERRIFQRDDCDFAYRSSIFKQPDNPWIILSVTLHLNKEPKPEYSYPTLNEALDNRSPLEGEPMKQGRSPQLNGWGDTASAEITPHKIFETVCRLRKERLPDPASLGNAGSFFKNPVVPEALYNELKGKYEEMPGFPVPPDGPVAIDDPQYGAVKIPAGWLLEHLGWKGQRRGAAGVHEHHALVLVNHGGATGKDILALAQEMRASVQDAFGITLQPEVCIVDGKDFRIV